MASFDVSEGAAYAVLYTVLSAFTVLAVLAAGYCGSGDLLSKLGCIMKKASSDGEEDNRSGKVDFFLAARSSAGFR